MLQLVASQERRVVQPGYGSQCRRVERTSERCGVVDRSRQFGTCSVGARGRLRVSRCARSAGSDSQDRDDAEGHSEGHVEAVGIEVALGTCQAHTGTDTDFDNEPNARAVGRNADRWGVHGGGQRYSFGHLFGHRSGRRVGSAGRPVHPDVHQ